MSERKRFMRRDPVVAEFLRNRTTMLPRPLYDWAVDWIEDVGFLMRDRGFQVSTVSSVILSKLSVVFGA